MTLESAILGGLAFVGGVFLLIVMPPILVGLGTPSRISDPQYECEKCCSCYFSKQVADECCKGVE
ncbi:hypothetical protein M193_gp088 [Halorubrum tailed phage 7]|uniref:hypothetical protein n=1 Tax=Halorubrum tailed phage 7 TaxID=2847108 RepID=UPI00033486D9|nr:hypothetical protein M193_gp088 [Halorubrum tailed phage 7]AGM10957.1 hypothetical protein HRTV7_86 [Halorubrum tailed phage 7]